MWDRIAGLPAHPLAVHAPVVLIPLVAVIALLYVVVPAWRSWAVWLLLAFAVAASISAWIATQTGEAFEELRGPQVLAGLDVEKHQELGESTLWWSIGLLIGVVVLVISDRLRRRPTSTNATNASARWRVLHGFLCAAVLALAAIAVTYVALTGHSGAEMVWGS